MSNFDDSEKWEDVSPKIEVDYFFDWHNMELLLGEFGEPGFSNIHHNLKWPSINPDTPMIYTFTCYRGDDGLLLGVSANYMVDEALRPFAFMVHPDHQRTGVGTLLANFVVQQYEEEHGKIFPYTASWGDARTTESASKWVNKYVKEKINGGGE